jgi:hypothetical protein
MPIQQNDTAENAHRPMVGRFHFDVSFPVVVSFFKQIDTA